MAWCSRPSQRAERVVVILEVGVVAEPSGGERKRSRAWGRPARAFRKTPIARRKPREPHDHSRGRSRQNGLQGKHCGAASGRGCRACLPSHAAAPWLQVSPAPFNERLGPRRSLCMPSAERL